VIWGPLKVPVVEGHGHDQMDQGQAATADHPGHIRDESHPGDISLREISVLVPIALAIIVLGVKPGLVSDRMLGPVQQIRRPLTNAEEFTRRQRQTGTAIAQAQNPSSELH